MQFQTVFAIMAAVASVSAGQLRTRDAAAQCGNGQKVSCCSSGDSNSDNSLLGGVLGNVLGGNCDQIPINIIGANGILQQVCGGNQAACCSGDENGLINVSCNPIAV